MRVLACTVPEAEARLRAVLSGEDVHFSFQLDEALRRLAQEPFDLVIIGMLFDESRGLELMQRLRENPKLANLPVVGIRGAKVRRAIPPSFFDVPMWSMGACDVIDFAAIADDAAGNREMRERLAACARSQP